jgi:1,2-phenylacetyl-CoA epoxidase catalytic subunit
LLVWTVEMVALVEATARAKRTACTMYRQMQDQAVAPEAGLMVAQIANDEALHAAQLAQLVAPFGVTATQAVHVPEVGCGLGDQMWPSALLAAFALDQAATAALLGLAQAPDEVLARTAQKIVGEEQTHQAFAIGAFRSVAQRDPAFGRQLGREMIEARDWVHQLFPRHKLLERAVESGVLPSEALKAHDSFLASLGDRIQEALGVLGD